MRILALHGLGASSAMLEQQIAPLVRMLGPTYQLIFLDGAIPCGRGPGSFGHSSITRHELTLSILAVPGWASGPFQSYASGFTPSEMKAAHDRLQFFIECNGPFDGVLGFSLGAAMAVSFIIEQQHTRPDDKPPFAFAVLFSPIFIASADDKCYEPLIRRLLDHNHADFRKTFPRDGFVDMLQSDDERIFTEYLRSVLSMHTTVGNILPANNTRFDFFDQSQGRSVEMANVPRLMHPLLLKDRIRIPSVVVTGGSDVASMAEQSRVAQMMCASASTRSYKHDGGHDVPFRKSDVQAIVSLIQSAAEDGMQISSLYDL